MSCLITINGGLGKHVMATALMSEMSRVYGDVHVVSHYLDVMLACPSVHRAYLPGDPNLLKLVDDPECTLFPYDPYDNPDFIRRKEHLFQAWGDLWGIRSYVDENLDHLVPDLMPSKVPYLTDSFKQRIKDLPEDYILLQLTGGQSCLQLRKEYNPRDEAIKRNYPYASDLIKALKSEYPSTSIVYYALPNEAVPEGVIRYDAHYLHYREIARNARAVITIDSSLQHIATGTNDHVYVIWGETEPRHFGYPCNIQICSKFESHSPYFRLLGPTSSQVDFPTPGEILDCIQGI